MAIDQNDPRPVLRQELARVFKNQRVIRAFEKIFDLIPPEFIDQQAQLDALDLITVVSAGQNAEALSAIDRLSSALEKLAVAPLPLDTLPPDDIAPRIELGDVKLNTVEFTNAAGAAILLASSVTLANGAAAAAGTLLNAPVAGNPTKWVTINDNGTNRQVPAW